MRTIKEALEDGSLSLEDEIDYDDTPQGEKIACLKLEIERLNNIIKRLEEFIEKEIEFYTIELTERNKGALGYTAPIKGVYKEIYNVLQELKGNNSNENI